MPKLPQLTSGKPWKLRIVNRLRVKGEECWGQCRWPEREILITKSTERNGVSRQVFLHELMHKIFPWMDEDAVDHMATEIDEGLDVMDSLFL